MAFFATPDRLAGSPALPPRLGIPDASVATSIDRSDITADCAVAAVLPFNAARGPQRPQLE
jgi:hypothetical protein